MSAAAGSATERAGSRSFALLERVADGRAGIALVAGWAFLEAIVLPVVPDVVLCLLVLASPRRAPALFGAVVAGSLGGTAVLYLLTLAAPDAVHSLLLALPGIGAASMSSAQHLVASGDPMSIAQLGPGTPLKVYTAAWATGPATPLALALGVVLNRITRILPGLLLAAAAGWLAPAFIRRHDRLVLVGYTAFWIVAYVLYLR